MKCIPLLVIFLAAACARMEPLARQSGPAESQRQTASVTVQRLMQTPHSAATEVPSSEALLQQFSEKVDSCAIKTTGQGGAWYDLGNVSVSDMRNGGKAFSPNCAVRSGNSPSLISRHTPAQEIWARERVYLSDTWQKPVGGAAHFWRFWRDINPGGSGSWEMIVDQVDGGDNLAMGFMPQAGAKYAGSHGEYWLPMPVSLSAHRGRWMCWEVHLKINTPGQRDGLAEFYLDGERLLNATGLNQIGNGATPGADNRIQHVNWMSNVGGRSELWPGTNYWFVDDMALGPHRIGCD